ncbi:MAG: hypothetical protein ABIR29_09795, partial [Chthoniobacterales bacterium]
MFLIAQSRFRKHAIAVAAAFGLLSLHLYGQNVQLDGVASDQPKSANGANVETTTVVRYLEPPPVQIFSSIGAGYDDNFLTSPRPRGSWFSNARVTLSYAHRSASTQFSLVGGGGILAYIPARTDTNAFVDLSVDHKVSRRLSLNLDLYASYQAEPDFGANIGPSRRAGNYFQNTDTLSATYQLARRWSSVSSYTARVIRYDDRFTAAFTDRTEQTFAEELRYDLSRTTTLAGDYRFELVDYTTAPRDSSTHFLLAGVDEQLTRRLRLHFRGGVSLRSYATGSDSVDPHLEGSLDYAVARRSTLSLN